MSMSNFPGLMGNAESQMPANTGLTTSATPTGPLPSNLPLAAYQGASATSDQQKTDLLNAIAQLGSTGKAAYNEQQAKDQQARQDAMRASLATNYSGDNPAVSAALQQAFTGQSNAGQQALDQYTQQLQQTTGTWFDMQKAAIPVSEARTRQQVNEYYQAQQMQRQQAASQFQLQEEQRKAALESRQQSQQIAALDLQIKQVDLQKAQMAASGKPLSPSEQLDLLKLTQAQNAPQFQQMVNDKANAMNAASPGHGDNFKRIFYAIAAGSKNRADAQAGLDAFNSKGQLTNIVRYEVLSSWLDAYFSGTLNVTNYGQGNPNAGGGGPGSGSGPMGR